MFREGTHSVKMTSNHTLQSSGDSITRVPHKCSWLANIRHECIKFIALLDQAGKDTRCVCNEPKQISMYITQVPRGGSQSISISTNLRRRGDLKALDLDKIAGTDPSHPSTQGE